MKNATVVRCLVCCVFPITAILIGCGSNASNSTSPPDSKVTVSLNQSTASVPVGWTIKFSATVMGSTNMAVTWSVDGVASGNSTVGTISANGLYTAPPQTGSHKITATSVAQASSSATATVSVVAGLALSPASADLAPAQTQQFSVTSSIPNNSAVTWSVDDVAGGNATVGTITSGGLYTAPASTGSHTITATSTVDSSSTASATIVIFTLSISPSMAAVNPSSTQQFTLNTQGTTTAVTWSVDGIANGNSSVGTINSSGLYTAPFAVGAHTIAATSTTDSSASAPSTLTVMNYIPNAVLTYHNDDARDGAYLQETTLTPTNVNSTQFGKLLAYPVDGQIYAQPLYFPGMTINGASHDVIFVATQNNSLYAFDADATSTPTTFWHDNFGPPFTADDSGGPWPNVGIFSTPVIDGPANIIYAVSEDDGGNPRFYLHALNAGTGIEQPGSPVPITASYSGDALETSCYQRMGLALDPVTNSIYIAFGSCDNGWLVAYDKTSLAQTAAFNVTSGGQGGGLWASGGAPAVDDLSGDVYLMSGTDFGDQQWITGNTMVGYNDSFLRLDPTKLSVLDYFSPDDNYTLASNDADLGAGANVLVPGSSTYPDELVGGGKDGNIFVIDRDKMGGFNDSANNVLQTVHTGVTQYDNIFSTPVYWNGSIYIHCNKDVLRAFSWSANGNQGQQLSSGPTSIASTVFGSHGATPSLSANGAANGIIWDIDNSTYVSTDPSTSGPAVLHAYDARNVANELYNSAQAGARDTAGLALKFTVPTIANGRVFVPTGSELDIYGLLQP